MTISLSTQATFGALKRKVTALRKKVSDYDAETAEMKRKAERAGGPAARFAVDMARSPKFHALRERLRTAELAFASWDGNPKKINPDLPPFSAMVQATINRGKPREVGHDQ